MKNSTAEALAFGFLGIVLIAITGFLAAFTEVHKIIIALVGSEGAAWMLVALKAYTNKEEIKSDERTTGLDAIVYRYSWWATYLGMVVIFWLSLLQLVDLKPVYIVLILLGIAAASLISSHIFIYRRYAQ